MKTTRKSESKVVREYMMEYEDWPSGEMKTAHIFRWENGEGYDVWLGDDKIELSHQEISVLMILFGQGSLIK